MAVLTLEDEQIVSDEQIIWCENGTNKSSDIWPSGKTIFPRRFVRRDAGTSRQMPDDLSFLTICLSSSEKTANELPVPGMQKIEGHLLQFTDEACGKLTCVEKHR